ncbi:hypothetical protein FRC01_010826 [Tulasnella sp. 417]|nr:hypothetical protein FRC01_010826 [Tulasnella sp. 417]
MDQGDVANSDALACSANKTAASRDEEDDADELEDRPGTRTPSQESESPSEPDPPFEQGSCHIPIHSLPTELLLEVIRLEVLWYIPDLPEDYYSRLVGLSGVCCRWYHVIRDSPELWTRMHGSDSPEIYELAMKRSSGRLLDIVLEADVLYRMQDEDRDHLGWFMAEVRSHVDRWRSVEMSFPPLWTDDITCSLEKPAPNLERLSLYAEERWWSTREHNFFFGEAPKLRDVKLEGIAIRWDSEAIHNLTALDLSSITFHCTDDILEALSHSPELRTLVIKECTTRSMASASCASIQLLQLSILDVDLGSPDATEDFLDHIKDDRDDAPAQLLSRRKRVEGEHPIA